MQARLIHLGQAGRAQAHPLADGAFRMGRHEDNDLALDNPYISRFHAEVIREGSHYAVRDLGSTSGTFVNFVRVKHRRLRDGDCIRLGRGHGVILTFEGPSRETRADEEEQALRPLRVLAPDEARFLNAGRLPQTGALTMPTLDRLRALYEFTSEAIMARSVQEVADRLADCLSRTLGAERCAVLSYEQRRGVLRVDAARPVGTAFAPSRNITERVYRDNVALLSFDAQSDERFAQGASVRFQAVRSVIGAPMGSRARVWGVCYADSLSAARAFNDEELEFMTALARQAGTVVENLNLLDEQRRALDSFIRTLAATLDARDDSTAGHSARVGAHCQALARLMGLSEDETRLIYYAGLLHDYGKVGIRDDVLLKPAKLTPEEYEHIKQHPVHTYKLLSKIRFPEDLADVPTVAAGHHERWDGTGYPGGLAGDDIPLGSRIVAVVDAFDALTEQRVYSGGVPLQEALEEIVSRAGTHFDPAVAEAFRQYFWQEIEPRKRRLRERNAVERRAYTEWVG